MFLFERPELIEIASHSEWPHLGKHQPLICPCPHPWPLPGVFPIWASAFNSSPYYFRNILFPPYSHWNCLAQHLVTSHSPVTVEETLEGSFQNANMSMSLCFLKLFPWQPCIIAQSPSIIWCLFNFPSPYLLLPPMLHILGILNCSKFSVFQG